MLDLNLKNDVTNTEEDTILVKLNRILRCLEGKDPEPDVDSPEVESSWFHKRNEKLRIPVDPRKDEIENRLTDRLKQQDPKETKNKNLVKETPNDPPKDKKNDKRETPDNGDNSDEDSAQVDCPNLDMGLLQGPLMDPFSVEMVKGKIIVGCQCIKRNGLQSDCRRKLCKGRSTCTNLPLPLCVPSGHGRLKPKETKVFIRDSTTCPSEDDFKVKEKKDPLTKKNKPIVNRNYVDNPPVKPVIACEVHKRGRYYIRPAMKNIKTQTEDLKSRQLSTEKYLKVETVCS